MTLGLDALQFRGEAGDNGSGSVGRLSADSRSTVGRQVLPEI